MKPSFDTQTKLRTPLSNKGVITGLQNHFLISTNHLNHSIFSRSIVYVCTHDANGAMGVIINRPMENVKFTDIADSMNVEPIVAKHKKFTIFNGGPVDKNRGFVIHSPEYQLKSSMNLGAGITLSANADIVNDIAHGNGPKDMVFSLGYAGWSAGQLEAELVSNSWLVLPADAETLFDVPHADKYEACTAKLGLNAVNFMEWGGVA